MRLDHYLLKNRMTAAQFAAASGVHKVILSLYLSGKRGLSLPTAAKIVRATGGLVSYEDLLPEAKEQAG